MELPTSLGLVGVVSDFEASDNGLSGIRTVDATRCCGPRLPFVGVRGPGRLKLPDNGSSSLSSFSLSTTGSVMVRRKTLGAATMPNIFSHMFLSLQFVMVGKRVAARTSGLGRSFLGHQRGIFGRSLRSNRLSPWKNDSGEALGDGKRRLGALDECAGEGKSVYAGKGIVGEDGPGTTSFDGERAAEGARGPMMGDDRGLGPVDP